MTARSTGRSIGRRVLTAAAVLAGLALALTLGLSSVDAQQAPSSSVRPPPGASVPGGPNVVQPERPGNYDVEMWKKVREGLSGQVSIPDKKAGQLVQSDGEAWRNFRNGPLPRVGLWAMVGRRRRARRSSSCCAAASAIEHGWAGRTITRFTEIERYRPLAARRLLHHPGADRAQRPLRPLCAAAADRRGCLLGHLDRRQVAPQLRGLRLHGRASLLTFVVWIRHNFPSWRDIVWLAKGGGMFVKGSHPPAWKFNAGQKILFWLIMLGGLSLSLSGLALMFPFQTALFAKTFALVNMLGFHLPTELTPVQEMQYATSWHGIVALALIVVVIAHIYIGTLGMQGAFSAMGSGQVDVNWAKEHHSLWAEREIERMEAAATAETGAARPAPAE